MGIGNDIKPKKVYRYVPPHRRVEIEHQEDTVAVSGKESVSREAPPAKEMREGKKSAQESTIPANEHFEKLEELEDDFFHDDQRKEKSENKEGRDKPSGFWFQNLNAKNFTWLILIALAVIVIYQNFDNISALIRQKTGTTPKVESKKEDFYEGVSNSNKNTNLSNTNSNSNLNSNSNTNTNQNSNSAASTAPVTTTPTTTSTVDKSTISLRVLNGNGIAGSAETVATELKTAGFNPINTSNARKFTYAETIVYFKTGKEAEANTVKDALSERTASIENSDSIVGSYDVIVVVGKK